MANSKTKTFFSRIKSQQNLILSHEFSLGREHKKLMLKLRVNKADLNYPTTNWQYLKNKSNI